MYAIPHAHYAFPAYIHEVSECVPSLRMPLLNFSAKLAWWDLLADGIFRPR